MKENFLVRFMTTRTYLILLLLPIIFIVVLIFASMMGLFYIGIANLTGFDYTIGIYVITAVIFGGFLLISLILIILTFSIGIRRLVLMKDWQGYINILASLFVLALLTGEVYAIWYVGSHF